MMMLKSGSVIIILAFALLIQNTCPHGFAGKTSVVPTCNHCTLMQYHNSPSPDGMEKITSGSSSTHFPLFVFAIPKTIHTFQPSSVKSARIILADRYKDALPDELLRPPQA